MIIQKKLKDFCFKCVFLAVKKKSYTYDAGYMYILMSQVNHTKMKSDSF